MKNAAIGKPTILIFKETLLPLSETFIEAQARHLSCFIPRYVGLGRVAPSLPLASDAILLTTGRSILAKLAQKLYRRLSFAPAFDQKAASANAVLIHAHFASGGRSALPLAERLHIPLIVTLHGSDVTTRINFLRRYRDLWNKTSLFLCVSEFIRRKAAKAGFPEEKLRVHYIGIDRNVFQPRPEPKNRDLILFVGRLVEKKGCAILLQAMANVQRHYPAAKTVVIGDGPLRSSLEQQATGLGIPCQFLGSKPAVAVRKWLAAARVLCAPSVTASNGDSEGAPMVILEAQAMGVPVVSTRHAGIPELLLDGQTGLLAPEGDSETLALHLLRLLEDELFWKQCGEQGIESVRSRFDLSRQTRELENIYAAVVSPTSNVTDLESRPTKSVRMALSNI